MAYETESRPYYPGGVVRASKRGGTSSGSLALAVIAVGLLLLGLALALWLLSPLQLEPVLLAVSILVGAVLSIVVMILGREGFYTTPIRRAVRGSAAAAKKSISR